jgi:DnaJ-class molecular chaperone
VPPVSCIRATCPDCNGESADYRNPPCKFCLCQGHIDIDRTPFGAVPKNHPDGRPVRLWIDHALPEYPNGPT